MASNEKPSPRKSFTPQPDDPQTTNDESNDQPLGHFGTVTLSVTNQRSGNTYSLDADVEDREIRRIYFTKGGWVNFPACEVEEDMTGECEDEQGRVWTFEGEGE